MHTSRLSFLLMGCALLVTSECGHHHPFTKTPWAVKVSRKGKAKPGQIYVCNHDTIQWKKKNTSTVDYKVDFGAKSPITGTASTSDGVDHPVTRDSDCASDPTNQTKCYYAYKLTMLDGKGGPDPGVHIGPDGQALPNGQQCP